jgi:hypothetical protein
VYKDHLEDGYVQRCEVVKSVHRDGGSSGEAGYERKRGGKRERWNKWKERR